MRSKISEYGPHFLFVMVVIAAILQGGCAGTQTRDDPTPKERAQRALMVSAAVADAAAAAYESIERQGWCESDERLTACMNAFASIVVAQQTILAAESVLATASGEDEPIPCVVDALAHMAEAVQALPINLPSELRLAFDLLRPFQTSCMTELPQ